MDNSMEYDLEVVAHTGETTNIVWTEAEAEDSLDKEVEEDILDKEEDSLDKEAEGSSVKEAVEDSWDKEAEEDNMDKTHMGQPVTIVV